MTTAPYRLLAMSALAAILLVAAPAHASAEAAAPAEVGKPQETPRSTRRAPQVMAAEQARVLIFAFARCNTKRDRRTVEWLLAMSPMQERTQRTYRGFATENECLGAGQIKFDQLVLRGALFSSLYGLDYARAPGRLPAEPIDWAADTGGDKTERALQYTALRQFADCAVRADPADARAAVLSAPASEAETEAFARLAPNLNGCAVKGQSVVFTKTVLSGLLAEVLYRDAKAAK